MFMRSNKNAAIFLDRDGTIIEDYGHLKDPSDVVFWDFRGCGKNSLISS